MLKKVQGSKNLKLSLIFLFTNLNIQTFVFESKKA